MNPSHAFPRTIRRHAVATAVACCFAPMFAWANPVGPVVTHGQASFSTQGKTLTVNNTPGSIINWRGFSIGVGEITIFNQQTAASAVLNRVVSGEASSILGALQSNGRVFLINPNGIIFGAGAQINTAGLVASTLSIMDADFLTGKMRFGATPDAKSITNAGEIVTPAGGRVMLIAPEGVTNTGIINTPQGEVILAAGKTVELTDTANPEVRIEVSAPQSQAVNLGKIVAEAGKVGVYGAIASNRGVVSANSAVVGENGKIVFRATKEATLEAGSVTTANGPSGGSIEVSSGGTTLVAGSVQARGEASKGGDVKVLGEQVGLVGTASIDVSGAQGGGSALVGGDLQGANASIQNAKHTYVGADTRINADALTTGDGGKVIAWADDTTRSYGSISARGGQASGHGGFVETSGKLGLEVTRGPDVRAPAGRSGTWLLDPVDLEIVAGGELDTNLNSGAPFFAPLTESSRIGVDLINGQLDFGSNVILTTTSRGESAGTQQGNITISAPIVKNLATDTPFPPSTNLTLQAHNNIVIGPGGSITSNGDPLSVTLTANVDSVGTGSVTVGGAITTRGGSFVASGSSGVAINAAVNTMKAAGASDGAVQLTSGAGAVTTSAAINSGFFSASGQTGVTIGAPVTSTSSTSLTSSGGTLTVGSTLSTTSISLTADSLDIPGTVALSSGSTTIRQNTTNRAINLGTEVGSALSLTQSELDHITGMTSLSLGNSASGALTVSGPTTLPTNFASLTSGNAITLNAALTSPGQLSFVAPTVSVAAPLSSTASTLVFNADYLNATSTVTSSGNIDVSARTFNQNVKLGVASKSGTALELTAAELDNFFSPTRLRFGINSGSITIEGAIAPTHINALSLATSNGSITDMNVGTVKVTNLALTARTGIDLHGDNEVGTLAASTSTAANITFVNKPNTALGIGTVDGTTGVRVFGSGTIDLKADDMNIAAQVRPNTGDIKISPRQTGTTVTLGADTPSTLGLTTTETQFLQGTTLTIAGDRMDISGPVTFGSAQTTLSPISTNRPVSIGAAKIDPAKLEFTPGEFSNIAANMVTIGGPNAGRIDVTTPTVLPGSVSHFVLHSADAASGITTGANIDATNTLGLTADTMTIGANVRSTNAGVILKTHSPTQNITLGTDPGGTLGFDTTELSRLSSSTSSSIEFSTAAGDIAVTNIVSFGAGSTGGITLGAGNAIAVNLSSSLSSPASIVMKAPSLNLNGTVNATSGDIELIGDAVAIAASTTVNAPAGNIIVSPYNFRNIDLGGADTGSNLGLTQLELANLNPSGVLRIGDLNGNTGNINISSALTLPSGRALSLKTGSGSVSQTAPIVIANGSLAVEASDAITLTQPNQISNVALMSWYDNASFVRAPGAPLTVTQVDDVSSTAAGYYGYSATLSLTADRIDINSANPNVSLYGSTVALAPPSGGSIDIGSKPGGGGFGLLQDEFDSIHASVLTIGNGNSDNISVTQPIASFSSTDLSLVTGVGRLINVGASLSAYGNLALTGGTINTSAALNSVYSGVNLNADSITLGGTVSSGGGYIKIAPLSAGTMVSIGGPDVPSTGNPPTPATLGLDGADLGHLAYGTGTLTIGATNAGNMSVTHEGSLAGNGVLETGAQATFSSNSFGADGSLRIVANSMALPGNALTAGTGMTIAPATNGRAITLGSKPATGLELDATEFAKISVATGALTFDTSGTLTTSIPLAYVGGPDLTLKAGALDLTGGLVSADGNIEVRADTLSVFNGVQSLNGGRVTFAPRSDGRPMALGTQPVGSLGLTPAQIAAISTTGVVQFGDLSETASLQITAPISQPANASALTLLAEGNISQPSGTVTATNLRAQSSFGSVVLAGTNDVDVLAGTAPAGFSFSTTGALTIGSVDGASGVTSNNFSSSVTLRSDALDLATHVAAGSNGTVTLAPLSGGAVNVGSDTGFGLTNDELNRVTANTLALGTSGTNPTGSITVSAPIEYTQGNTLNLQVGTGGTINVNAGVGSSNTGNVSMTATGGTLNVNAPIVTSGSINLNADVISSSQAITSEDSSVSLFAGTNGNVTIGGAVNGYFGVQVTGKTISVNAPVTANYDFSSVTLGAASGSTGSSVTVNNQVTAGSSISITTDSIAINAPLVTLNSSMALQPRTSGTPISLGTETAGAFSLTTAELALLNVENLTIGSSTSGPLTINAPLSSSTIQQLNLRSNSDITQSTTAPITLTYSVTDPQTGFVQPLAGLNVVSSTGKVDLPADNNINNSVTGQAGGSQQNFIFKNTSPLKLQNVSSEIGFAPTGKTLFNSPPGKFVPVSGTSITQDQAIDATLAALLKAEDTQKSADDDADARKEDDEKKDREERKKEGKKSCS